MINLFRTIWALLRRASGDDAYERYLAHRHQLHPGEPALNREEFYKAELERKWNGIRRCC